jgi:NitT/TauT family transport system permease protein
MLSTIRNKIAVPRPIQVLLAVGFWVAVWQLLYLKTGQEILMPSPAGTLIRLFQLAGTGSFWLTVAFSVLRITAGFLAGVMFGALFALLTARYEIARVLLRPAISVMRATPVASFIILALVWIRSAWVPVFATAVVVLPIVWENISEGIRKTDGDLLQMARVFRFGRRKTVRLLYLPSVKPYVTVACAAGMGLSWKAGVAAEVLSSLPFSIGGYINDAKIYLDTESLFAWTAVVILLSVLLERMILRLMKRSGRNAASATLK